MQLRPLTRRQQEILILIEARPIPPTIRDLCRDLGLRSTNSVHQHLKALETKGAIVRSPFEARAIRSTRIPVKLPLGQSLNPRVSLPLAGTITPGGRVDWSSSPANAGSGPRNRPD